MDEFYAVFVKNFGPVVEHQFVPDSSIEKYKGRLPDQLLNYWKEYGWSGYQKGLFWTVNPQDYECILGRWLAETEIDPTETYHVIARSAFGELYAWGENSGYSLVISAYMARYYTRDSAFIDDKKDLGVQFFFLSMKPDVNNLEGMFERALESLGALKSDEMYGFVPALALGGPMELKNLQKVKVIEHLELLSQLSPLQDWGFPDI